MRALALTVNAWVSSAQQTKTMIMIDILVTDANATLAFKGIHMSKMAAKVRTCTKTTCVYYRSQYHVFSFI
jgi:hypothetical protein